MELFLRHCYGTLDIQPVADADVMRLVMLADEFEAKQLLSDCDDAIVYRADGDLLHGPSPLILIPPLPFRPVHRAWELQDWKVEAVMLVCIPLQGIKFQGCSATDCLKFLPHIEVQGFVCFSAEHCPCVGYAFQQTFAWYPLMNET